MKKEFNDFAKLPVLEILNKKIEDIAKILSEDTVLGGLDSITGEIIKKFNDNRKNTIFKDYALKNGEQYDTIELIKIYSKDDVNVVHFNNLIFDIALENDKYKITDFKLTLSEITFSKYIAEENISLDYIIEEEKIGFTINNSELFSMFFLTHNSTGNGFSNVEESSFRKQDKVQEKIKLVAKTYQSMINNNIANQFMDIFLHQKTVTPEYIEMLELLHDIKVKDIFNENYMINIDLSLENLKKEFKHLTPIAKSQITI